MDTTFIGNRFLFTRKKNVKIAVLSFTESFNTNAVKKIKVADVS